jgi:uncharacterized protein (TIGR03435 family)
MKTSKSQKSDAWRRMLVHAAGTMLAASYLIARSQSFAQSAMSLPEFEVASVKTNTQSSRLDPANGPVSSVTLNFLTAMAHSSRGGLFRMERVPLNVLIDLAYKVRDYQILGAPAWATSDRYDITAKAEGNATFEQMRPMLQSLLADRFKLVLHHETKERPVYELDVARAGLKIVAAKDGSCVTVDAKNSPLPIGQSAFPPCGSVRRSSLGSTDRIEAFGISMRS